ncbi:hypothetical protein KDL29_13540 [bacterium]|nr:hypothetical protein [bacterium]
MQAMRWLLSLIVIAVAAMLGMRNSAVYHPPADSGEARLQERALQFYRASARFDYYTMVQLYTPAQQTADSAELNKKARRWKDSFETDFDEAHRNDLEQTAADLSVDDMDIQVEGDWALIKGEHNVHVEGQVVSMALDPTVWVRSGGDWWMYQMSNPELVAYGNPPDFARKVIFKREFDGTTLDMDSAEAKENREQLAREQAGKDDSGVDSDAGGTE